MLTDALECFHDSKLCGFLSLCSSYKFGLNHIQHLIPQLSSLTSLLCYLPLPHFIFIFPSLLSLAISPAAYWKKIISILWTLCISTQFMTLLCLWWSFWVPPLPTEADVKKFNNLQNKSLLSALHPWCSTCDEFHPSNLSGCVKHTYVQLPANKK